MELQDQNLLVTGAAGLIGQSVVRKALSKGATLILTDINKTRVFSLKDELDELYPGKVHAFPIDLTNIEGIKSLLSLALSKVPHINSAVHCAYPRSIGWGTDFEQLQPGFLYEDLNNQLGISILFSQQLIQHFLSNGGGHLIHIASIYGVRPPLFSQYKGTSIKSPIEYTAIKAGIISITSWLAKYYRDKNIRVNCISPGGIFDSQPEPFPSQYRRNCSNIGLLKPTHISESVIFLLSAAAEAINGQNIVVDDGWTL